MQWLEQCQNIRWKENNIIVLTWQSLSYFFKRYVKEIVRLVMFFVVADVENDKLSALMVLVFSLKQKGIFHIRYVLLLWIKIIKLLCPHLVDIQIREPIKQCGTSGKPSGKQSLSGWQIWKIMLQWNWLSYIFCMYQMVWYWWVMVFNAIFNNISVTSWRSVLLVVKTAVPREYRIYSGTFIVIYEDILVG